MDYKLKNLSKPFSNLLSVNYSHLCLCFLFLLISSNLYSQESARKNNLKIGYGISLLGSGDYTVNNYINEYSRLLSPKLEGSVNIVLGLSSDHQRRRYNMNYFQSNLNLSYQILKINNIYKLKIGGGGSIMDYSFVSYFDNYLSDAGFRLTLGEGNNYFNIGYNIRIENEIKIKDNFFINISGFGQFYYRPSNQNIGILLMGGYSF